MVRLSICFLGMIFSLPYTHHILITSSCCSLRYHIIFHPKRNYCNCDPWLPTSSTGFHGFDIYKYPLECHLKEEPFFSLSLVKVEMLHIASSSCLVSLKTALASRRYTHSKEYFRSHCFTNSSHTTISSLASGMVYEMSDLKKNYLTDSLSSSLRLGFP